MDASTRVLVQQRAGDRCEYCLLPREADAWPFHVEHVIASQHGGNDQIENLCWACSRCNLYKGPNLAGVDPSTGAVIRLFHPRKQKWNRHFDIDDARINGKTSAGRATVRLLRMNDQSRVELRRDLIERDVFLR
jgi:hypothetical protein